MCRDKVFKTREVGTFTNMAVTYREDTNSAYPNGSSFVQEMIEWFFVKGLMRFFCSKKGAHGPTKRRPENIMRKERTL